MVETRCPTCGKVYELSESMIGRKAQCKQCGAIFVVPQSTDIPSATPATSPPPPPTASAPQVATPAGPITSGASRIRSLLNRPHRASGADDLLRAKILLAAGLVLVLLTRGCDSIGRRGISRANAKLTDAMRGFEDEYGEQFNRLDKEEQMVAEEIERLDSLIDKEKDADAKERLVEKRSKKDKAAATQRTKIGERRTELTTKRRREERQLTYGDWRDLRIDARDAAVTNDMRGYWREWVFVIGSICLMIGCILVGFKGSGAERLICLIMIAIVTFSIYVGGVAWVSSVQNTMQSAQPGVRNVDPGLLRVAPKNWRP